MPRPAKSTGALTRHVQPPQLGERLQGRQRRAGQVVVVDRQRGELQGVPQEGRRWAYGAAERARQPRHLAALAPPARPAHLREAAEALQALQAQGGQRQLLQGSEGLQALRAAEARGRGGGHEGRGRQRGSCLWQLLLLGLPEAVCSARWDRSVLPALLQWHAATDGGCASQPSPVQQWQTALLTPCRRCAVADLRRPRWRQPRVRTSTAGARHEPSSTSCCTSPAGLPCFSQAACSASARLPYLPMARCCCGPAADKAAEAESWASSPPPAGAACG